MPAQRDSWEQQLLDDPDLLRDMAGQLGRPFHIMYPARVTRNIRGFQQVFAQSGVTGDIYYGKKANKSPSVVRARAETGVGVDVSSCEEFRAALRGGIRGMDPMVTGPTKSDELLRMSATYGHRLRTSGIRLSIEPGRALLDRVGCTVFRIQGVKVRLAHEIPYIILTVDGTSPSLSEQWFDSEYLPDPALWPPYPSTVTPTCVGGSSCLETDMLSRRRIPLPRAAITDDLLIYPNTGGYQMDSNESRAHGLPLPPKIILRHSTSDGLFDREIEEPCET
ncbi:hypothetical protein GPX89_31030 [Nocardia sp. ET3-3]|uniref:Orn/DAP/Arg decarboxylase 2 N-terminal domain-containing protein n=2 Tax=Nocardia terrae TaxID=2675851 RepID=A0A7K1V4T0_9NOCA|nr:hypothetical protein [Nocardia terrae]